MKINHRKILDWRCDFVALVSGALLPFSLAPYNIWPLGILATTMLALTLVGQSGRRGFFRSVLFGLGMYGFGASWVFRSIHDFGFASTPLAFVLTSLFVFGLALVFALPFILYCKYCSKSRPGFLLGFASVWILGEWIRSWFLTGFPWLYLGYAHTSTWLGGWAPILGVFGIGFFAVLSGLVISDVFHQFINHLRNKTHPFDLHTKSDRKTASVLFILVCLCWVGGWQFSNIAWTKKTSENPLSVALVQPNIPQPMKWQPFYFPYIMQTLRDLTRDHWEADLVLWPENAVPHFYHDASDFLEEINLRAEAGNTALITGILYDADEPRTWYNSIIGLGTAEGTYFKQRLVPFGEYVPLEKHIRGLLEFFNLPNSVISVGPKDQELLRTKDFKLASYICYEIVYPDLVAQYAGESELLLTISNDAWFGDSIGPLQHFQMAQMRAMENGKYLLRATNTGVSGVISHKGEILEQLPQFEQGTLRSDVYTMTGKTPFAQLKSWPTILFSLFGFLLTVILQAKRHSVNEVH